MGLTIEKRIKVEMVKKGMSRKELAQKMGLSNSALGYNLSGNRPFSVKSVKKLIDIFPEANLKYEDFFE